MRLFAFFTLAPKFRDNGGSGDGGDRAKSFFGLLCWCNAARSTTTQIKYTHTHTHVYEYINTFVRCEEKTSVCTGVWMICVHRRYGTFLVAFTQWCGIVHVDGLDNYRLCAPVRK